MAVLTGNVQRCDAKVVESSHLKYSISVLLYIFLDMDKLRAIADSTRVCMHTLKGEQPIPTALSRATAKLVDHAHSEQPGAAVYDAQQSREWVLWFGPRELPRLRNHRPSQPE